MSGVDGAIEAWAGEHGIADENIERPVLLASQIRQKQLRYTASKVKRILAGATLLDGTPDEFLIPTPKPRSRHVPPPEQETDELLKHVGSIRATYGDDVLNLTTACKYVERLLGNVRVRRYLGKRHADILSALEQVIAHMAADKRRRPNKQACAIAGAVESVVRAVNGQADT